MFKLGYLGLFLASFLSATVIPFSSEAVLSAFLIAGYNPVLALGLASIGNWMGGMTSYYLGYLGKEEWISKYLRIPRERTDKFKIKLQGKEQWIAFFCWLPFIGDVIAVVLGLLRTNLIRVSAGMLIGKIVRYAVWGYFTLWIVS